jgi:hypothetical protein
MVQNKDMQFCMENLKIKKRTKKFEPSKAGIRTPDIQLFLHP